jgi:hypothetical protein
LIDAYRENAGRFAREDNRPACRESTLKAKAHCELMIEYMTSIGRPDGLEEDYDAAIVNLDEALKFMDDMPPKR